MAFSGSKIPICSSYSISIRSSAFLAISGLMAATAAT